MNKEFLETYPLLKKLHTTIPSTINRLPIVAINMFCRDCDSEQTFNMTNEYGEFCLYSNSPSKDQKVRLNYLCQSCRNFTREFYVYIGPDLDYICKIGQYPEWEIPLDRNLTKTFKKHLSNFKKGNTCESQGYGIGAFAYYRRITEDIIDELLDSIIDLIEPDKKAEYENALIETKKTRVTQEKIELVKDLLPQILRPNNLNPLGVLHSALSEGLHSQSDEECLEYAGHIRDILTFLINQTIQAKATSASFTKGMKKLLEKRADKK